MLRAVRCHTRHFPYLAEVKPRPIPHDATRCNTEWKESALAHPVGGGIASEDYEPNPNQRRQSPSENGDYLNYPTDSVWQNGFVRHISPCAAPCTNLHNRAQSRTILNLWTASSPSTPWARRASLPPCGSAPAPTANSILRIKSTASRKSHVEFRGSTTSPWITIKTSDTM